MRRSDLQFPSLLPTEICPTMERFWKKGVFDQYSEEHFLIRAMNGNIKGIAGAFYKKDVAELKGRVYDKRGLHAFIGNFLINFAAKLEGLCNYFGEEKIERFLTEQFSAGKDKYDENLFWQALSEVHMLCYFTGLGPAFVRNAEYEPHLGIDNKNPEARLVYQNDMILDIEVKTPKFSMRNIVKEYLLPSVLLDKKGRDKLSQYCEENKIECCLPRVLKIKDYINSAGGKFEVPKTSNHINILAINWTYSEFADTGLFEPISLFCNPVNGLFVNEKVLSGLGIDIAALRKISAVLLYRVPEDMLLFGDARYLLLNGNSKLIINPYAECVDKEAVFKMTHMNTEWPSMEFRMGYFSISPDNIDEKLGKIHEIIEEHILC